MSWLLALFFLPILGICRHSAGDPNCSSNGGGWRRDETNRLNKELSKTIKENKELKERLKAPDNSLYEILHAEQVGPHLVMRVQYPSCDKCTYEGVKVMVFLNCSALDALKWKGIDPHFGDRNAKNMGTLAPYPAARFPADEEGWNDAIEYAGRK